MKIISSSRLILSYMIRVTVVELMNFGEKGTFKAGFLYALFVSTWFAIKLGDCTSYFLQARKLPSLPINHCCMVNMSDVLRTCEGIKFINLMQVEPFDNFRHSSSTLSLLCEARDNSTCLPLHSLSSLYLLSYLYITHTVK